MPRNGSGVYTLPQPSFVAGTVISSAAVNSDLTDIASALTGSLPRDGQAGMLGQFKATDGSTAVPSITYIADTATGFSRSVSGLNSQIGVAIGGVSIGLFTVLGWTGAVTGPVSGMGAIPIGTIIDSAATATPTGWLPCFGQAVSRSTYSALFAAIGIFYGAGDGSTTFNVPDMRGRLGYGADNIGGTPAGVLTSTYYGTSPDGIGAYGGSQSHALTVGEIPAGLVGNNSNNVNLSVNSGARAVWSDTSAGSVAIGGSSQQVQNISQLTSTGLIGSGNISVQITNAGNQPHASVSPGVTVYKFIYAGV